MKYLEEIEPGTVFMYQNQEYLATIDFKKNNDRLCVLLKDGSMRWLSPNESVETISIYKMDNVNNLIDLKPTKKESIGNE